MEPAGTRGICRGAEVGVACLYTGGTVGADGLIPPRMASPLSPLNIPGGERAGDGADRDGRVSTGLITHPSLPR